MLQADPPFDAGRVESAILHVPGGKGLCVDERGGALVLAGLQRQVFGNEGVGFCQRQALQGPARLCGRLLAPLGIEPGRDLFAFDIRGGVEAQHVLRRQRIQILLLTLAIHAIHAIRRVLHVFHGVARKAHGQARGFLLGRAVLLEAEGLLAQPLLFLIAPFGQALFTNLLDGGEEGGFDIVQPLGPGGGQADGDGEQGVVAVTAAHAGRQPIGQSCLAEHGQ